MVGQTSQLPSSRGALRAPLADGTVLCGGWMTDVETDAADRDGCSGFASRDGLFLWTRWPGTSSLDPERTAARTSLAITMTDSRMTGPAESDSLDPLASAASFSTLY